MTGDIPPAWYLLITGVVLIIFGAVFAVAPLGGLQDIWWILVGFGVFCIVAAFLALRAG